MKFNPSTGRLDTTQFIPTSIAELLTKDHDLLDGLLDDDHTQYFTSGRADTWFTGKDLADLGTKNHSDLDQLAWSIAGHTIDTDIDMAGNDLLNIGKLCIDSTIDHCIEDVSGDFELTNHNADKDINFYINNGVQGSGKFFSIDSSTQRLELTTIGTPTLDTSGVFKVSGNAAGSIAVGMSFAPTFSGNNFIGIMAAPTMASAAVAKAFWLKPVSGAFDRSIVMLEFNAQSFTHTPGYDDNFKLLTHESDATQFQAFSADDITTVDYKWVTLGKLRESFNDFGDLYTPPTVVEECIHLTGGLSRPFGTNGSMTQTGLKFSGFGTTTNVAADSNAALHANGGRFEHAYDLVWNATRSEYTSGMFFGLGDDALVGYDGTDFVIATTLVGTGALKTTAGRKLKTSRYTTTQTIPVTDHAVFADTDGGAWTLTLPAGSEGQEFFITNCGGSGNALTIDGNGAETINGDLTQLIYDGESVHIIYNATEKWRIF